MSTVHKTSPFEKIEYLARSTNRPGVLGPLAGCAQLTAQAIAENFGIDIGITVEANGDVDLRGTLGIDKDVPVGFEAIRLDISVDGELNGDTEAALQRVTKRNCVVFHTLVSPPEVETIWRYRKEISSPGDRRPGMCL